MSEDTGTGQAAPEKELQDMIAESDTGARSPSGIPAKVLWALPFAWAVFQLEPQSDDLYKPAVVDA